MSQIKSKLLVLLLAAAFLVTMLSSCETPVAQEEPVVTEEVAPTVDIPIVSVTDNKFTVRYDATYSFNPITGTSPNNMALVPLMYEGLFVLNEKMMAEPVLCDVYETADGMSYTFRLKSGIAMSDGSNLTATDVKYSLSSAMQYGRFVGRLKEIVSITATDTLTLKITLRAANYKLPELLDIPIIKNGTVDQSYPPGSGPYNFIKTSVPRLAAFQNYRNADKVPVSVIYLRDCTNAELSVAFSSQTVDLFLDDPADASEINILSDHEIRYYNTTILQYVGFNTNNSLLADPDLRRAFGLTIDRKEIVSEVYSSHALAAPLILSPYYKLYNTSWENSDSDPLAKLSKIFETAGMADDNNDGFLELNGVPFSLTFIVNADNEYKVQSAQMIADSLKTVGINIILRTYYWDEYKAALENGSYDMYYGDVCLPADYDLTELLSPGGSLDYGNVANSEYRSHIEEFLSASTDDEEAGAARRLCAYISEYAPVIPVLYRQLTVHTNKNVVTGMKPTQSNIFYGLTEWKITTS